jgi:GNAT superfamily N-acetyltransferase
MSEPSTTLRAGRPSLEEGAAFARFLDTAAEGFFGFMLGPRSSDIIARAYLAPAHDLSHQNVTFAERDGQVLGMFSGFLSDERRRPADVYLRRAAGRDAARYLVISRLLAPLMRIIDTVPKGDFYAQAIAVDEAARGTGVGSLLLDHAEERARGFGSGRLALDVAGSNTSARAIYERRGWTVESQWPHRLAPAKVSFLRMIKTI